ncbi:MAG: hypothetical protein M1831_002914 [Alyxoria varia]|nr:MAG: hypothetical protein M1831_002914 [Alyxoria varia]
MNTEAALAIAAVTVAVLAMVISFSQVTQQFAGSAHQYRLCDSVVYGGKGGLPGQGRRVWSWTQLRFRVIYEVPTFGFSQENGTIPPNTPPSAFRGHVMDIMANEKHLSNLGAQHQVGEASWVSFCRKIKEPCHDRLVISLTQGDADRCPGDLPNIPVPVSLKDVLVMAFAAGLDCTEASFSRKTISMQGTAGSITSSHHPVLGPLIHFIPQRNEVPAEVPAYWTQWIERLNGLVPIANELLSSHGHRGLAYFEQRDNLATVLRLHMQEHPHKPADSKAIEVAKSHFSSFLDPRSFSAALDISIGDSGKDQDHATLVEKIMTSNENDGDDFAPDIKPMRHLSTLAQSDHPSSTFWKRYWSASHTEVRWMWMSQMNVISGCWATPWKFNFHESICRCAIRVIRVELISTYMVDEPLMARLSAQEFNHLFRHGMPLQSHPPYAVHAARDQRISNTYADEIAWVYFPPFDCKLPAVCIHFAFLDRLKGPFIDTEEDNTFYAKELMRFDYWMWRASETRAIIDGKLNLIRNTPAIVEYLIEFSMGRFEENYVFELDPKACREAIKKVMIDMGASEAERMFLFVAMLRTLRFAVCVCQGLDTSQALEILKKDIRAHMV